jgi:glycosyltransferase involved in cell wall biosynthesis
MVGAEGLSRKAIVLAGLCDYGAKYGKGMEFKAIMDAFASRNMPFQLVGIFRDAQGQQGLQQVLPFGNLFFRALVAAERLLGKVGLNFPSREMQDALFDFLAARRLPTETEVLFTLPGMTRTLRRAKELGAKTVLHGVVMHPQFNLDMLPKMFPDGIYPNVYSRGLLEDGVISMKYVDHVICPSTRAAESYLTRGYSEYRVAVVPLGFEMPASTRKLATRSKVRVDVLFVGNVTKMKGCDLLLDAISFLDRDKFRFHFVGEIQADMAERCVVAASDDHVIFHGQRPSSDFYPRCDILVLMSLSEGLARVLIEAGSHGLVVVTNSIAHGDLIVDKESGRISGQRPEELALVLQELEENRESWEGMSHSIRRRCSALTWNAFGVGVREQVLKIALSLEP